MIQYQTKTETETWSQEDYRRVSVCIHQVKLVEYPEKKVDCGMYE